MVYICKHPFGDASCDCCITTSGDGLPDQACCREHLNYWVRFFEGMDTCDCSVGTTIPGD